MTTPGTVRTPPVGVRAQLSAGLAELLDASEALSVAQQRNLLLDRCGSDHRPLVELLLRVGRHGTEDALRKLGRVPAQEWPARRATFVARVSNDLFVPADLAAWAVDSWAVAVGALSAHDNRTMHEQWLAQELAGSASSGAAGTGVGAGRSGSAVPTAHRRGLPARGARGRAPSSPGSTAATRPYGAGGAANAVRGTPPRGIPARGIPPRGSGSRPAPIPLPSAGRVLAVMATAVAVLAVLVATGSGERPASVVRAGTRDSSATSETTESTESTQRTERTASSPATPSTVGTSSTAGTLARGLDRDAAPNDGPLYDVQLDPRTQAINREVIRRTAIGSSADDVGPLPRPLPTPQPLPASGAISADLDTVVMDDGGILVGAIRLVAPNDLFVHDVSSGLEYALPRSRVARVVTRTGADLTLGTRAVDSAAPRPGSTASAMLDAGVGGTYRVEQRVRSVAGNSLCAPVAEALERDVIRTVEEVLHEPGTGEFTLLTRPGVAGTIDRSGRFVTIPFAGSRDGVRFVFRMSGQFTPGGFSARTVTETESIIRYRRTQACRIVADLLATRTLGVAP